MGCWLPQQPWAVGFHRHHHAFPVTATMVYPARIAALLIAISAARGLQASTVAGLCTPIIHPQVLKALSPGDHVLLLDERGREVSSEDIARIIAQAGDNGSPLAFVVGGPFGHGPAVVERANDSIRLSRMVLNHQVRNELLLAVVARMPIRNAVFDCRF